MSKLLAVMIAGLFAAGAYAQGTSQEAKPPTDTKPQMAADKKVEARPAGQIKETPMPKTAEGGAIGTDKAAMAGEKRAETRDARRRNKDGSLKRRSTQGGTPPN